MMWYYVNGIRFLIVFICVYLFCFTAYLSTFGYVFSIVLVFYLSEEYNSLTTEHEPTAARAVSKRTWRKPRKSTARDSNVSEPKSRQISLRNDFDKELETDDLESVEQLRDIRYRNSEPGGTIAKVKTGNVLKQSRKGRRKGRSQSVKGKSRGSRDHSTSQWNDRNNNDEELNEYFKAIADVNDETGRPGVDSIELRGEEITNRYRVDGYRSDTVELTHEQVNTNARSPSVRKLPKQEVGDLPGVTGRLSGAVGHRTGTGGDRSNNNMGSETKMARKINRLIQEAQTALDADDTDTASRKAFEAVVGAENAKDQRVLYRDESISDANLAHWFGTTAVLLHSLGQVISATRCFYTATVFDVKWTEQQHNEVSQTLWGELFMLFNLDGRMVQKTPKLFTDIEKLCKLAEERGVYEVCILITDNIIQNEHLVHMVSGQRTPVPQNPKERVKRIARCHLKLGHLKVVQTLCLNILTKLADYDDVEALELWARSLYLGKNYDLAVERVNLALHCAKMPDEIERLQTLRTEIQSKIPIPTINHEPDPAWLRDTCVSGTLKKSSSTSDLSAGKVKKSKTRHRRPKARDRSNESNLPSPASSVASSRAPSPSPSLPPRLQDVTTTIYNRLKKNGTGPNNTVEDARRTRRGERSRESSMGSAGFSVSELVESLTDMSIDSDTDDEEPEYLSALNSSSPIMVDEEPEDDLSFYEQTCQKYAEHVQHFAFGSESEITDEKLMTHGVRLNASYLHQSKDNDKWKSYYDTFLSEDKIRERFLQRPDQYKKCVIQIEGSHVSFCYPTDAKEAGLVIEISGRQKAGQTYNDDEVVVELMDKPHENKDRRYGKVVGLLNRQRYKDIDHPVFICTLDDMDSHHVRPLCKTVPKLSILNKKIYRYYRNYLRYKLEVYTYDHESETLSDEPKIIDISPGDREKYVFLVAMIKWSPKAIYPTGAVIRVLRCGDTIQRGLTVLNLKHKVPSLYKKETYASVEALRCRFHTDQSFDQLQDRRNLCNLNTFTIDPPGSQDLDDALSIEPTDDGFRVGVHIADVSAYVTKDDPIDIEAYERAVTFYPTIRRPRNMLAEPLSSNLISLHPNKQKLTISVFFLLTNDGRLVQTEGRNYQIVRSVIQSKQRFTYREVQDIINDAPGSNNQPLKREIMGLFELAQKIRKRRLGDAMFALDVGNGEDLSEDSVAETLEAHYLVEEFMIMANHKVAQVLVKAFPDCTPIRTQPPPTKESMEELLKKDSGYVNLLVRLQNKKICDSLLPDVEAMRADKSGKFVIVSKLLWDLFVRDPNEAMRLLKMDDLYPIQHLVYQHWLSIQERAEYQCSGGSEASKKKKHFSLELYPYTHFTSPIRRYNDLIIHRMLIALINGQNSPYSKLEVEQICVHVNAVMKRSKQYEKECKSLQQAIQLKSNPQMVRFFVDESTEKGVSICAPELRYVDKRQKQLAFNLLDMSFKPVIIEDNTTNYDKVKAVWRKRIYDTKGFSSLPPKRGDNQEKHSMTLNPHPGVYFVPLSSWARLLKCAIDGRKPDLVRTIRSIESMVHPTEHGFDDISTESLDPLKIEPYTRFSLTFSHGQTLKGQMASVPHKGLLTPRPVLYNMTENVKLCLLHMDDPVLHLSRYTTKPTSQTYNNADVYVNRWLPIIQMEAAVGAIANEESCIINSVPIKFEGERKGKFALSLGFCEVRNIEFSGTDDEENPKDEPKAYDWLCLKFVSMTNELQGQNQPDQAMLSKLKPIWVGHAEIYSVKKKVQKSEPEKSKVTVSFVLHEGSPSLPHEARQINSRFSLEVLRKSEVDRRTESYIKRLKLTDNSTVAMKVALNKEKMHSLDQAHAHIARLIERDLYIVHATSYRLPKNNVKQQEAIDKALTNRFSLIQGPPGTGKSYTGIKLMCLFNKINDIKHKEGEKKQQVLFCGPSNKSVDLVARWMLNRLGESTPKFIRVYGRSIEAMDFPIPGRTFLSRRSTHNLKADQELEGVSLHHLIRKKGEKNAEEINAMDRRFKAKHYAPDPVNVKKYVHLIREASIEMIRKYDVILCTTAVGSNPKVLEATSVFQVIVDEAGMCPEPQCLVPILATKAEQVVLIGDHKQLRPIIMCKEAAELGLDKSLFERYTDSNRIPFTMLEEQYRMNPEICRFPSEQFYKGKLVTRYGIWCSDLIEGVWPTKFDLRGNNVVYPHVLIHVEGEEKILSVSTEEGNEQSRSNQEEIDVVVKVYRYLIENHNLSGGQINVMSQYNAQVSEIKKRLESEELQNTKVSTVVSSQGGEWDYVIFSTVRSLPQYKIESTPTLGWAKQNLGFITDQNQINVALTRARKGIIIVGNKNLLQCDDVWKKLVSDYENCGCVKTPDEFPPRRKTRQEKMKHNIEKTKQRFGDTMFQAGQATSYDGPMNDRDFPRPPFRTRGRMNKGQNRQN